MFFYCYFIPGSERRVQGVAFLRDDICPSPSAYRDTFVIDLADEITVAEGVKVEKKKVR